MGKIKIATLGTEEEEALKKKQAEKREQKKLREKAKKPVVSEKVNLEREEKKEKVKEAFEEKQQNGEKEKEEVKEKSSKKKMKPASAKASTFAKALADKPAGKEKQPLVRPRSIKYKKAAALFDKKKEYSYKEAIDLVKKTSVTNFNGSVESHINVKETGLKVSVTLPYFTGKKRRIVICDDSVISDLEKGKINFDVLVTTPVFMPKLAKFAKTLGPRGLMPNPKAGTVTTTPEKVVKELEGGRLDIKTELKAPLIHTMIGKISQKNEELEANLRELLKAIAKSNIDKVTLASTMGPGIRVKVEE